MELSYLLPVFEVAMDFATQRKASTGHKGMTRALKVIKECSELKLSPISCSCLNVLACSAMATVLACECLVVASCWQRMQLPNVLSIPPPPW